MKLSLPALINILKKVDGADVARVAVSTGVALVVIGTGVIVVVGAGVMGVVIGAGISLGISLFVGTKETSVDVVGMLVGTVGGFVGANVYFE